MVKDTPRRHDFLLPWLPVLASIAVLSGVTTAWGQPASPATPAAPVAASPSAQSAQPAKPVDRQGAARLTDRWPDWLELTAAWRGRTEATRPLPPRGADYDTYYLNRLRVFARARPNPRLAFTFEGQDSHALSYPTQPLPRTVRNRFDVRQGYVELRPADDWLLRVGRQEFRLTDGRLVASPDWGNTNRTFDLVRGRLARGRGHVELFAGAPVVIEPRRFDESSPTDRFYGVYGGVARVFGRVGLDPYVFVRTVRGVTAETGGRGRLSVVTMGARVAGQVSETVGVAAEWALQRGAVVGDEVEAWAGHTSVWWRPAGARWRPRLTAEYNVASGDRDATDGRRQTFDQLYPTNHNRYGQVDLVGWRNLRHAGVRLDVTPQPALAVSLGLHDLRLWTVRDALYASGGAVVVRHPGAASARIGTETDVGATWTVSRDLSLGAGLGVIWAGDYLRQSAGVDRVYVPYLTWTVAF